MEQINEINQSITALSLFPDGTAYESWDAYLNDVATWLAENKTLSAEIAALVPKLNTFVQEVNAYGAGVEQYGSELTSILEQIESVMAQLKLDTQAAAQNAAQSAIDADEAKTFAQSYANAEEDVEVAPGKYSSKHFFIKSVESASVAEQHKDATQAIKEETQTIKEDVELQAQNAAQSATDAEASKTLAQQAAQDAQAAAAGEVLDDQNVSSLTGWSSEKISVFANNTLAQQHKTYIENEESILVLSKPTPCAIIGVRKEVPQLNLTNNDWNVDVGEFEQEAADLTITSNDISITGTILNTELATTINADIALGFSINSTSNIDTAVLQNGNTVLVAYENTNDLKFAIYNSLGGVVKAPAVVTNLSGINGHSVTVLANGNFASL